MSHDWHTSTIKRTLLPGQHGGKKIGRPVWRPVGLRPLPVRPRATAENRDRRNHCRRTSWRPDPQRLHPNTRLSLRVGYDEVDVRNTVKAAGGKWDARQKVWKLAYEHIVALKLTDRIVPA